MTDEDIKKLAAALKGADRDSFSTFRGGLLENWPLVTAIVAIVFFVFNSFNAVKTANLQQDARIDALTNNVVQLTSTVSALAAQTSHNNESQNKIQQDIALIKADVATIKERIK